MRNHLLILFVVALSVGCSHHQKASDERLVKVNVMEVSTSCAETSHEYAGTIEEAFSSSLSFGASGRVTAVYVKDGQKVQQGQLLAKVDNSNALNSYRAAKATLDQAQDGYDRAKLVYDRGSLPEVKWTEVQTQLNQAQSVAEIAKKNLSDCELRAPTAGTISNRNIEVGTSVTAFQPVMHLVGLDGMYVKASIPEGNINNVKVGQDASVWVNALEGQEFAGKVEERNPNADPLSHSYMVRIRLKEKCKELLPGMVCRVQIKDEAGLAADTAKVSTIEIPNRAVQLDNKGARFVWVVEDSCAAQRYVTISDLTRNGVLVSEGLRSGDKVIVDGMLKVSAGTKVRY